MAPNPDPPPGLMAFAEELRAFRAQTGMSREDVAAKVNYSPSLIGMIETGRRSPTRRLAELLDAMFGTPETFVRHEKRLRGVPFSEGFRPFQPYEAEATTLRLFEHTLVPGLFQTEGYARATLAAHPHTSADVVEERVAARLARQQVLTREDPPAPILWVLLDENVLRREVGGRKIMRDQVAHLAEVAEQRTVTVQVIPSCVVHPGLHGAFAIAELPGMPAVVYLETARGGQTIEDPDVAADLSLQFDVLRTEALAGSASLSLIEKVVDEWND
jgi:transcriptional regulator with XRE-family HTH domain